jgi:hypothetical protein
MSAIGDAPGGHPTAGFTLLEMLVAMAIMALVAGIGFPVLQRRLAERPLDTAAHDLAQAVAKARADALASGAPVRLSASNSDPAIVLAGGRQIARLPVGVTLDWPATPIGFYPDGSVVGGTLVLHAGQVTRTIAVDRMP